jgi:hypothetical protein
MKSWCLFVAAAAAILGGCAERPSGRVLPDGQRDGRANEVTPAADPSSRQGSPSGRYGRPSSGGAPRKLAAAGIR